ncbi:MULTISPECIES: GtrA family protein [unclassified Staphylococcus]|uniref:GtrA family protein n=1 Tax=Staphylococcus TaxID=1279 RepID=UPI001AEC42DA|nr:MULTISPECIES: GtrA family protein [unclassified Staphylococcus]
MSRTTFFEIIKFIIVGAINTLNYYIIYLMFTQLLNIPYLFSHITSFLISFVVSFFLNCLLVYKVKPTFKKFILFPTSQIVNMGTQTLLLFILVEIYNLSTVWAPLIGLIITIPVTFIISKSLLSD